ncbi:hypothetical protein ACJJTC_008454 [Scirpophaga incertulas]
MLFFSVICLFNGIHCGRYFERGFFRQDAYLASTLFASLLLVVTGHHTGDQLDRWFGSKWLAEQTRSRRLADTRLAASDTLPRRAPSAKSLCLPTQSVITNANDGY